MYRSERVGPFGLLQSVADAIKLPFKEQIIPEGADRKVYFLAPIIATVPALQSLWTASDDYYEHRRRYSRSQLVKMFSALRVEKARYWGFPVVLAYDTLFLLPMNKRRARRNVDDDAVQARAQGNTLSLVPVVQDPEIRSHAEADVVEEPEPRHRLGLVRAQFTDEAVGARDRLGLDRLRLLDEIAGPAAAAIPGHRRGSVRRARSSGARHRRPGKEAADPDHDGRRRAVLGIVGAPVAEPVVRPQTEGEWLTAIGFGGEREPGRGQLAVGGGHGLAQRHRVGGVVQGEVVAAGQVITGGGPGGTVAGAS